jgi:hypothetical protein
VQLDIVMSRLPERRMLTNLLGLGVGLQFAPFGLAPLNPIGGAPALGAAARSPIPNITSPNAPNDPPLPASAAANAPASCSLVTPLVVADVAIAAVVVFGASIAASHNCVIKATATTTLAAKLVDIFLVI